MGSEHTLVPIPHFVGWIGVSGFEHRERLHKNTGVFIYENVFDRFVVRMRPGPPSRENPAGAIYLESPTGRIRGFRSIETATAAARAAIAKASSNV